MLFSCDIDIDECAIQEDNCDNERGNCTNTDGGYECSCRVGYSGDGTEGNCTGIDKFSVILLNSFGVSLFF